VGLAEPELGRVLDRDEPLSSGMTMRGPQRVLPDPVPPDTMTFIRPRTHAAMTRACAVQAAEATRSCGVSGTGENLRIVRNGTAERKGRDGPEALQLLRAVEDLSPALT